MRGEVSTADRVKAAYILNFTHFVKWAQSPAAGAPFTVCAETTDGLEDALNEALKGKDFEGHAFAVRKLAKHADVGGCQVAFFSGGAKVRGGPGSLTIADEDTKADADTAVIRFVLDSNRVRFNISNKAAEQAGLSMSSKLLSLALKVDR